MVDFKRPLCRIGAKFCTGPDGKVISFRLRPCWYCERYAKKFPKVKREPERKADGR